MKAERGNGQGSLVKLSARGCWIADWYRHDVRQRARSTGTTDRAAAERILREWIAQAALRGSGVFDARGDRYADAARQGLAGHVGAGQARQYGKRISGMQTPTLLVCVRRLLSGKRGNATVRRSMPSRGRWG